MCGLGRVRKCSWEFKVLQQIMTGIESVW